MVHTVRAHPGRRGARGRRVRRRPAPPWPLAAALLGGRLRGHQPRRQGHHAARPSTPRPSRSRTWACRLVERRVAVPVGAAGCHGASAGCFGVLFVALLAMVALIWLVREIPAPARAALQRPSDRSWRLRRTAAEDSSMFTKILIANRGEIACRVAATARRTGHPDGGGVLRRRRPRQPRAGLRRVGAHGRPRAQDSYLRWRAASSRPRRPPARRPSTRATASSARTKTSRRPAPMPAWSSSARRRRRSRPWASRPSRSS